MEPREGEVRRVPVKLKILYDPKAFMQDDVQRMENEIYLKGKWVKWPTTTL